MVNKIWVVERKTSRGNWKPINQGSHFNGTRGNAARLCADMRRMWPDEQYRISKYTSESAA